MALDIDELGTIQTYQGDSGSIFVGGFKTDKNFRVYLAIYNKKREPIIEKVEETNYASFVEFKIFPSETKLLTVPLNKESETYYYGIKSQELSTNNVDTLFVANGSYGDLNEFIVYPEKVKGE